MHLLVMHTHTHTHIHAWVRILISIITVKIAHLSSFRGQSRHDCISARKSRDNGAVIFRKLSITTSLIFCSHYDWLSVVDGHVIGHFVHLCCISAEVRVVLVSLNRHHCSAFC